LGEVGEQGGEFLIVETVISESPISKSSRGLTRNRSFSVFLRWRSTALCVARRSAVLILRVVLEVRLAPPPEALRQATRSSLAKFIKFDMASGCEVETGVRGRPPDTESEDPSEVEDSGG
jgi:hypothetical protein